jgi:hypothetical protein
VAIYLLTVYVISFSVTQDHSVDERRMNLKGCGHGQFKVLSWYLSGGTEENHNLWADINPNVKQKCQPQHSVTCGNDSNNFRGISNDSVMGKVVPFVAIYADKFHPIS